MTWDALYRDHWAGLLRYLRKRHNPGDDVEDIAQRAVIAVWRQNHPPETAAVVVVWALYRAARDAPRRRRTSWERLEGASDAWERLTVEPPAPLAEWFPDDADETDRRVLVMSLEGKMTPAEIGEEHGRTKSWAVCAMRRAVGRVAKTQAAV